MFERFTDRARHVIVYAQDEARGLGHGYIGTEHLLLGLLRQETGAAAQALQSLGVEIEETRAQVARIAGRGETAAAGEIPFTPHAKRALEFALQEARSLGHDAIDTEHILLGLLREGDGVGAQVLSQFGVDLEGVHGAVVHLVFGPARMRTGFEIGGQLTPTLPPPTIAPTPVRDTDSNLLRGILIGWALAAATLGGGLVVGWLIWG